MTETPDSPHVAARQAIADAAQPVGYALPEGDESIAAAGGWCAPSDTLAQMLEGAGLVSAIDGFPKVSVARGGLDFTDRRTDAEKAAADTMRALVEQAITRQVENRGRIMDAACIEALANGWDVHVYHRAPWAQMRDLLVDTGDSNSYLVRTEYQGIRFLPAKHPVPTIVVHTDHDVSDWDDEDFE